MSNSHDDDAIQLMDRILAGTASPVPVGPDGGFSPAVLDEPMPIPLATPENFVCLRGPCSHYMETESFFPAGNTPDTLAKEPVLLSRFCMRIPSSHIELTDEAIYKCNQWAPMMGAEIGELAARRSYYESTRKANSNE